MLNFVNDFIIFELYFAVLFASVALYELVGLIRVAKKYLESKLPKQS
jgi:hypothetical protein